MPTIKSFAIQCNNCENFFEDIRRWWSSESFAINNAAKYEWKRYGLDVWICPKCDNN